MIMGYDWLDESGSLGSSATGTLVRNVVDFHLSHASTAAPEPGTLALLGLGGCGLVVRRRHK